MLKRIAALLLALTCCISTAFAWSCPGCGGENSGKFCTECGTKKPANVCPVCGTDFGDSLPKFCTECGAKLSGVSAAATAVPTATPASQGKEEAAYTMFQYNGRVCVLWDAADETQYTVHYFPMQHEDVRKDMTDANLVFEHRGINSLGMYACNGMVPGEAYWVGVLDENGVGEYMPYIPQEEVEAFTACEAEVNVAPVKRTNGEDAYVEALYSAELEAAGENTYGLYLAMLYDNAGEALEVRLQMVLECPNGFRYVARTADTTLGASKKDGIGWRFMDLKKEVDKLRSAFGQVPAGEYKAAIYLNGQFAGEASFEVRSGERFAVNGFAPLGNGAAEVSWTGGKAPYTVAYCLCSSADAAADQAAAEALGLFHTAHLQLQESSTTLYELIPGEKYWIIVSDAQGQEYCKAVKLQSGVFADFDTALLASSAAVDANTVTPEEDYKNGVHLGFVYNNPGEAREVLLHCVVDYGEGRKKVTECGRVVLQSGKNVLPLGDFASLDEVRQQIAGDLKFTVEGDVTLRIYLDGKLAGEAVLPAEVQIKPVEVTEVNAVGNGQVTLEWINGTAPYEVYILVKKSEDVNADIAAAKAKGDYWRVANDVQECSITLDDVAPGVDHWLLVYDANSNGWYVHCKAGEVVPYTAVKGYLECVPHQRIGENATEIGFIPTDTAGADDDVAHGAAIRFHYDNAGAEITPYAQLVLTLPGGDPVVVYAGEFPLSSGVDKWRGWNYFNLEFYLNRHLSYQGQVQPGDVKVQFYLDGKLAGEATVPVAAPTKVEITGVTDNGNGTQTIRWADNGKGPYDVQYFQRFTDDMEADRRDSRGSGWWDAETGVTGTSAALRYLVPGKSYWITVTDSVGNMGSVICDVPAAQKNTAMGMTIERVLRKDVNGQYTDLETFSAAALNAEHQESYGLYLDLCYNNPKSKTSVPAQWVLTLPDGVSFCEYAFDLNLYTDGGTCWDCYTLDWAFDMVKYWYGEVLKGEYRMDIYLEGDYAASTTFVVAE